MKEKVIFLIKAIGLIVLIRYGFIWILALSFLISSAVTDGCLWGFSFYNNELSEICWGIAMLAFIPILVYFLNVLFGIFKFIEKYNRFVQIMIMTLMTCMLYLSSILFSFADDDDKIFALLIPSLFLSWVYRQLWCFLDKTVKKRRRGKYENRSESKIDKKHKPIVDK